MLREQRPEFTPLELDRVKLRAMSGARRSSSRGKRSFLRSRPAMSLLTVAFLAIGTGGALAGGGSNYGGKNQGGSASYHQYRCPSGYELVGYDKCAPIPPPKCKSGYELKGGKCVPCPPPPPKCKSGYELKGSSCVKIPPPPPPPPKCKSGYEWSGNKCVAIPPPSHHGH